MMMNFIRRICAAFLLAILFSPPAPALAITGSTAPRNPDFIDHHKSLGKSRQNQDRPLGDRPSPLNLTHVAPPNALFPKIKATKQVPAFFELRPHEVTPVRDQGYYGTCWAFASLASMESTFVKLKNQRLDFSEWHLAYFAYVDENETMPGFTQDLSPGFGTDPIFDQGGSSWQSAAILARWTGAVSERTRPYQHDQPWPPFATPLASDPPLRRLEHVYYLGNEFNETVVKNALVAYGAVDVRVVWEESAYNPLTNAFYNQLGEGGGHRVALVGWDDHYPASRFSVSPGTDGAWLVKNSWGTEWGADGYFWLSYADPTISSPALFFGMDVDEFNTVYQYDPLGWTDSYGYQKDTAWFANIFRVPEGSDVFREETLQAVSFYTGASSSSFRVEVWKHVDPDNPRSGLFAGELEGVLDAAGYHTIRLPRHVELFPGNNFAVVVRIQTPGYDHPVPIESRVEGYSEKAAALPGQSFASKDGVHWDDMTDLVPHTNVCLKAFTSSSASSGGGGCTLGAGRDVTPPLVLLVLVAYLLVRRRNCLRRERVQAG